MKKKMKEMVMAVVEVIKKKYRDFNMEEDKNNNCIDKGENFNFIMQKKKRQKRKKKGMKRCADDDDSDRCRVKNRSKYKNNSENVEKEEQA